MVERERTPSDIEVTSRQETVAPAMGITATPPPSEVVRFVEWPTDGQNPNQLLIPGYGLKRLQEELKDT